jgi:hypothetical protein
VGGIFTPPLKGKIDVLNLGDPEEIEREHCGLIICGDKDLWHDEVEGEVARAI